MRKLFEEYGFLTLSVIVVTLLIAIASPVSASVKNSVTGLITKFANTTNNVADTMGDDIANLNDNLSGGSDGGVTYLSLDDKYVGYYADTNGDGTADGVIFFDYAHGATTDTGYLGTGIAVTAKTTGLANYKLVGDNIVQKVGEGDDRFYVIALEDALPISPIGTNLDRAYWYKSAYSSEISDYDTVTSVAFGTGKTNTSAMLTKWNTEAYGAKDNGDMWSNIPNGWFVPSNGEWKVLGSELKKVSTGTYRAIATNAGATLSFSGYYWTSSLNYFNSTWTALFNSGSINSSNIRNSTYARVATTY